MPSGRPTSARKTFPTSRGSGAYCGLVAPAKPPENVKQNHQKTETKHRPAKIGIQIFSGEIQILAIPKN
jgi:hypothetical protein